MKVYMQYKIPLKVF